MVIVVNAVTESVLLEVAEVAQQSSLFVCSYNTVNANMYFGQKFHKRCNCMRFLREKYL